MSASPHTFVLDFFSSRGRIPGETLEEQLSCEYLRVGLLDSLRLIDFIVDIETKLGIEFESADFDNPKFKTIGGLIEILESKTNH